MTERVDLLVEQRVARSTGATILLLDQRDRGDEADPETRWETVCADHGSVCSHLTRALARSFMAAPEEWCDECRAVFEKSEARRLAAEANLAMIAKVDADRLAAGKCRHCGGPVPCWSPFGDVAVGVKARDRAPARGEIAANSARQRSADPAVPDEEVPT